MQRGGQRGRGRGYQDAPQQGGGQRGNPRGRGYGPPRGRQDRGSYTRQDRDSDSGGRGHEGYSRGRGEGYSRGRGEGYSRGRGYGGAPRGDRGGYRGSGDSHQEWNPFPEGPGSHPPKHVKFDAEDFGMKYKMQITPSPMPPNPGEGKLGKKIKLISNCFALKAPSGYVYHYDVDIFSGNRSTATGPETAKSKRYRCLNTKRNREVVQKMMTDDPRFAGSYGAYDGKKNLLSRIELDMEAEGLTVPVSLPHSDGNQSGNPDLFEVVVKPVKKKDSNDCSINLDTLHAVYAGILKSPPLDAVMAIETILRHGPCLRFTPVGRSFFYPPLSTELHPLGGGLEIWFGYHQSVRLGQWTPMVNLDMSSTAFYQERPMLDCVADVLGIEVEGLHNLSYISDNQRRSISGKYKNKQIEATHTLGYRRKYRFLKLTDKPANKLEFPLKENGVEVKKTVQRFFQETYNKVLEYPHLPCIHVHPEKKNIYLPIEFCVLSKGQHCKKKLDDVQTAEMIKFTARAPSDRFHEIKDIRNERAKYEDDPVLKGYGDMSVYNEPLQLEARILNVPGVLYKDNQGEKKITPFNGAWDMRGTKYFRGAEINSWVLVNFANPRFCSDQALQNFSKMLCEIASGEGIAISRPSSIETFDIRRKSVEVVLRNAKKTYNADLAIVVIPNASKQVYKDVKQAAETILGLVTQCITDRNLSRNCKPQVVSNLCQKINAKMGGVNNSLMSGELPPVMREPVMIIGADVTHSSPTSDNSEFGISIAAVVASLDKHPSRYAVTVRAQKNRDDNKESIETIVELKGMMVELLKAFYRHTKHLKPKRIIFYRDGVSEGQFDAVQNHEIKALRNACKEVQKDGYEPAITFLVVQKRHHTRFLPQDSRQGVGRMKNIPPGTTVDTVVTHPSNFDFFLCSHVGIQGTSRPCHYTVLHDDNKFSADDLQKLTFYLCHTYARCTRSISCPSPVMYAHLAAYRATKYFTDEFSDTGSVSSGGSSARDNLLRLERVQKAIKVIPGLADTMYFV